MNTRYNKSKIMRLAHHMKKYDGYTMSQALKLAWSKARRSEYYLIIEKPKRLESTIGDEMNLLADTLINYYANNTYNGD